MSIDQSRISGLSKSAGVRGNLTFVEEKNYIRFDIRRNYYISDVAGGNTRQYQLK